MRKNLWLFLPMFLVLLTASLLLTGIIFFVDVTIFPYALIVLGISHFFVFFNMLLAHARTQKYLNRMGRQIEGAKRDSLMSFPLPICVVDEAGEIEWYNDCFRIRMAAGSDIYGQSIYDHLPQLDVRETVSPDGFHCAHGERLYSVYGTYSHGGEREGSGLYLLYFIDDTELKRTQKEYEESRPCVMISVVDNYEELMQDAKESERAQLFAEIEGIIEAYVNEYHGYLIRVSRSRYIAIVEERGMRQIVENKFQLLDRVRGLPSANEQMPPTLSIGVGRGGANLIEAESMARQALDMALGRGGDQAAVRNGTNLDFYGGVSKGIEKRTKVKTRIMASALAELIQSSDGVVVMGHRLGDLDSLGSAVGILAGVRLMGKPGVIAVQKKQNLALPLLNRMIENGYADWFSEPEHVLPDITRKTLCIIVDTHVPHLLESKEVYEACRQIVVIDHHRKMVSHIDNAVIFYHEPFASSASEMVTELLQYFPLKQSIGRYEAEAMLAGIMLDTKNFVLKTGVRTFEAAAYLRRLGADTVAVRKLFAGSMADYQRKIRLVAAAEVYRGCAISGAEGVSGSEMRLVAPQAADELLSIEGVDASFVYYDTGGEVSLSGRSMGAINVQLIMETLGGGGHQTMAGAQLKNTTLAEARKQLIDAIDRYFESINRSR